MKAVVLFALALAAVATAQHRLDVQLRPDFGGKEIAWDTLALTSPGGQSISLTRVDMLFSSAALQRGSGEWIGAGDWAAYASLREGRAAFALSGVPAGRFTRMRFAVGVPPKINSEDPAHFPADHPLNPAVNGLHWGWRSGFVFFALEGRWRDAKGGGVGGFSFHVATDTNLATIELPVDLDLTRDQTVDLRFDLASVLKGVAIADETATTHSREGDPLAAQLRDNLRGAFSVISTAPTPTREAVAAKLNALIAPGARLYRFTFPASFPRPALPADNPLTEEGVALGQRLFHETRLSGNGTQSCASCHNPALGFSDPRPLSTGAEGDRGERHSMPLLNLAWKGVFFWDGRAPSLRAQVLQPIENPIEMHATLPGVVKALAAFPHYPAMFSAAFGSEEINSDRVARALEQFLLTLVAGRSRFDRAMLGDGELSAEEKRGFELFNTEFDPARGQHGADCFHCHGGALFVSVPFANNGLDVEFTDAGRGKVTARQGDYGKFAVPTLRNVANTGPYMHDGRFTTLEEVVDHYNHGLRRSATLDANLAKHPLAGLGLSAEDKRALVAFLKSLSEP